jgi:hypothetical protein
VNDAIIHAGLLDLSGESDSLQVLWDGFLGSSMEYHLLFTEVVEVYRGGTEQDSLIYIELEDRLLMQDSIWIEHEAALFGLLGEEGER